MKGGEVKRNVCRLEKGVNLYQFIVFYCELDSLSLLNFIGKFALEEERRNLSAIESKLITLTRFGDS